jgi:GH24 family phage-related lysozyme (muramidase)
MADDTSAVVVSFTADLTGLEAGIARAQAAIAGFTAQAGSLSKQAADAGRVANDTLRAGLEAAGAGATNMKSAVAAADASLVSVEKSAARAGAAFGSAGLTATYLTRETRALLDEASSNRWRQFDGTLVNLGFHLAQAGAGFLAANPLIAGAGAAAAAAGEWLAYLAFEATRTREVFDQLKASLNFTGIDQTDAQIIGLTDAIRNLSGVTQAEATKIAASLGAIQSAAARSAIVAEIPDVAKGLDIKPEEAAKKLEAIFENPFEAAKRLSDIFGTLTDAEQALLQQATETGDANKALAASIDVVADRYEKSHEQRLREIDEEIRQAKVGLEAAQSMGDAGAAAVEQTQKHIGELEAERAKIAATNAELRKQAGILNTTQASAEQLKERFDDVLKSISPWTSELEKAQGAIASLRAALQASTGDAATLIRQFEGFKDKAYVDSDGRYRVGFGSDTTTDASGQKHEVTSDTTTTREDAERDLARRIVEFQTEAARQIGPAWARLTDEAKASITSVAYNYGHVPTSVVTAVQTGGNAEIAGAIGSLSANPGRRAQEAANITHTGGAAITDPAKIKEGNEAIAEQQDRINALNAAKSGGTEIEKATLANLQAELAGRKDDVAAAQRLVEATKRQLADAHSLTEQRKLQADLATAEGSLRDRRNAAQEAQLRLGVGEAQGKGDAAGQRDAEVALANFKMSLYAKDSAAFKEAQGEKEAAIRQFAATEKQVAMEGAQAEMKSVQSATQAKIRDLDMEAKAHRLTEQEQIADVQAALAQEIAKERDILNQELALDNLRPQERKRILDELAQLEQQYAQQIKQVQTQEADAVAKSWQDIGKTIEGAVNSQLRVCPRTLCAIA